MLVLVLLAFLVGKYSCEQLRISQIELPELEYLNTSVDPCENFYEYACGNFKNVHPRPEQLPLWDNFAILQDKLHALFRVILGARNRDGDPKSVQKARASYAACIDVRYADALEYPELLVLKEEGPWPLIDHRKSNASFSWHQMGDLVANYGLQYYVRLQVIENLLDVSQYLIMISQDTVSNPSFVYRNEDNSYDFLHYKSKSQKHPFEVFLLKLAVALRDATHSRKSKAKIETEVAEIFDFMQLVQRGGNNTGGNANVASFFTVASLQQWINDNFPNSQINFVAYLEAAFAKTGVNVSASTNVMVSSMSWFYGILDLIANTDDDLLLNFVFSRLLTYSAPDSNNEIRDAYIQFRKDMGDVVYSKRDYCTRFVLGYPNDISLSMAATYEYQRYHFNINKIDTMSLMIKDLQATFMEILNQSEWLDESSRIKAKEKADKMIALLGYPDFVTDGAAIDDYYSNVRICIWDHYGNAKRLRAFNLALNLALLDKPHDKQRWSHSPLLVNAFYNSQNNRIILPVSILNPIFYDGHYNAIDYARIGAIIGHEITHGFDNQGSQYDGDGNISGWWSAETKEEFKKREQCFREQYGGYFVEETGKYIDPNTTMRENLADNGGLREAFLTFEKLSTKPTIEGYTPEQLFFISYGTMWCSLETGQHLEKASNRGYSPAKFRVIGTLSNSGEFAKAFDCPVGSSMNPARKCILW